jgi:hypothetical protein
MKVAFLVKGDDWGELPFYFNLTHAVGKGYPNAPPDDVGFVQLCFAAIAASSEMTTPPNLKDPWAKVRVTGKMDQETQDGIDAWQADRRSRFGSLFEVDGIFSAVPPGLRTNYAKETPYAIVSINYVLLHAVPSLWPRVDKHALAGPVAPAIRAALSSALTG